MDVTPGAGTDEPAPVRRFFPGLFAVEALVALAMLIGLIVLAAMTRAPLEATASRDAAGFTPRPEWYFLWFFQILKYFKGSFEAVGTVLIPVVLIGLLVAIPFLDRRPPRTKRLLGRTRPLRVLPRVVAIVAVAVVLALTIVAATSDRGGTQTTAPVPVPEWPPQSRGHDSDRPVSQSMDFNGTTRGSDARVT